MQPERLVAGERLGKIVGSMQPEKLVDGQMLGDWAASLVGIPEWLAINSMQQPATSSSTEKDSG
jgi:hypothetical protein